MSYETIIWEQEGAVGRLTLNRPTRYFQLSLIWLVGLNGGLAFLWFW